MRDYLIDEYINLNETLESLSDLRVTLGDSTGPYRDQIHAAASALESPIQQALQVLRDGFTEEEHLHAINRRTRRQRAKYVMSQSPYWTE